MMKHEQQKSQSEKKSKFFEGNNSTRLINCLQVSDDIPYGNVTAVETSASDTSNHVAFTAAAHGGIQRLWFCFRITNPAPGQLASKTELELKHVSTMLGGNCKDCHPVIRYDKNDWERLPAGEIQKRDDGHFSMHWTVTTPQTYMDVAFCYPYGYPEIDSLIADCKGYWHRDEIGVSQEGNPIFRLSNSTGKFDNIRPGIYLTARQHAAEVSGAWVLDGFLRRLAERGEDALLVWCVPLTNIDGILAGDYGKNPYPHDLNRAWDFCAPMRHETVLFMKDMSLWQERCRPVLYLDFHSPCMTDENCFCFALPDSRIPVTINRSIEKIAQGLKTELSDYASENFLCCGNYKASSTWGQYSNAAEHSVHRLGIPALSLETSYQKAHNTVLQRQDYQMIGQKAADGVCKIISNM